MEEERAGSRTPENVALVPSHLSLQRGRWSLFWATWLGCPHPALEAVEPSTWEAWVAFPTWLCARSEPPVQAERCG